VSNFFVKTAVTVFSYCPYYDVMSNNQRTQKPSNSMR